MLNIINLLLFFFIEIGSGFFFPFITFFRIKRKLCLKVYEFYSIFTNKFFIFTGYSWSTIIDALSVAILFQLFIKLYLSLVNIKFTIIFHFFSLFIIFIISVKIKLNEKLRNYLAEFLLFNLPVHVHECVGIPWGEPFDPVDVIEDEPEYSFFSHLLELLVYGLITCRLFFLSHPFFSFLLKMIITWFFIINNFLTFSYFMTFIICFSRFIFFLCDINFSTWYNCVLPMLGNERSMPKITLKNIKMLTYYSLRGIADWEAHLFTRDEYYCHYHRLVSNARLKDKFKFERDKKNIFEEKNNKNIFFIKFIVVILLFVFVPFEINFGNSNSVLYCYGKLKKNFVAPGTILEKNLTKNFPGHQMLFKITKKNSTEFFLNNYIFTSIKKIGGFPPKIEFNNPPLKIFDSIQHTQGISLISVPHTFYNDQLEEVLNFIAFEPSFINNLLTSSIYNKLSWLDKNSIIIPEKSFRHFTREENELFTSISFIPKPLPLPILRGLWSPACTSTFSVEERKKLIEAIYPYLLSQKGIDPFLLENLTRLKLNNIYYDNVINSKRNYNNLLLDIKSLKNNSDIKLTNYHFPELLDSTGIKNPFLTSPSEIKKAFAALESKENMPFE